MTRRRRRAASAYPVLVPKNPRDDKPLDPTDLALVPEDVPGGTGLDAALSMMQGAVVSEFDLERVRRKPTDQEVKMAGKLVEAASIDGAGWWRRR